jgi:hypothetical protein
MHRIAAFGSRALEDPLVEMRIRLDDHFHRRTKHGREDRGLDIPAKKVDPRADRKPNQVTFDRAAADFEKGDQYGDADRKSRRQKGELQPECR